MTSLYEHFYNREYQERLGRALYPWAFPPEDTQMAADGAVRSSDSSRTQVLADKPPPSVVEDAEEMTVSERMFRYYTGQDVAEKPESTYSGLKDADRD